MDDCRRSSSSSRWRHPTATGSTSMIGRFLPSSFNRSVPRPPLPPPLLPRAGSSHGGDLKLERAPTPTRADRLLVAPEDEHTVTLCFPRHNWQPATDVKTSNDLAAPDLQADSDVMSSQHNHVDARGLSGSAVPLSDRWTSMISGDWAAAVRQVPDTIAGPPLAGLSGGGSSEVEQTEDDAQPSTVRHRLPPASRHDWTTAGRRRGMVHLDAKYWERRRKNNEAAKRSRDIRRANERRVALQASLLERENARLRCALSLLTDDTLRLHYYLLCSRTFGCDHPHHHAGQ